MKVATLVTLGVGLVVGCGVPALIAGVVGIGVVGAWRARRRALAYAQPLALPAPPPPLRPPVERWAAGAWGLWSGAEDSGTWERDRAVGALSSWYGADSPEALKQVIEGLAEGQTGNPAWDVVRAIDLLRIGVAAGYLTDEDCFAVVAQLAAVLRGSYGSWDQLADAFEAGMNSWQDSRGITDTMERSRVRRNRPYLLSVVWPTIPWDAPL